MQKLSNRSKKRDVETGADVLPKTKTGFSFALKSFDSNILFLLALHDKRIASLIDLDFNIKYKDVASRGNMCKEKALECNSMAVFNHEMRFFTNLQNLKIASSRKVYLSSFNGIRLNELVLQSIKHISLEDADNTKVFTLRLIDMEIETDEFISLLNHCKPAALFLQKVECLNLTSDGMWKIYQAISSLHLLSLEVHNSFLDFGTFKKLIIKCEILNISFTNDKIKLSYKARTAFIRFCRTDRTLAFLGEYHFRYIEAIHIGNTECIAFLSHEMPRLKYLAAEDITIDPSFIRAIGPLRGLSFVNCTFKNLCFYELVRKTSKTLKFLNFERTEIPLDSYLFLREMLYNCQVVITGSVSFYIKKEIPKLTNVT